MTWVKGKKNGPGCPGPSKTSAAQRLVTGAGLRGGREGGDRLAPAVEIRKHETPAATAIGPLGASTGD